MSSSKPIAKRGAAFPDSRGFLAELVGVFIVSCLIIRGLSCFGGAVTSAECFVRAIINVPAPVPTSETALQPTVADLSGDSLLFRNHFGGISAGTCGNASCGLSVWSRTSTYGRLLLFPCADFTPQRKPVACVLCNKAGDILLCRKGKAGNQ